MSNTAIKISGLEKTYRAEKKLGQSTGKRALKGVDLTIKRGQIYGLLGPNGAGKSTLINILAGLVMKTAGQVEIWESDLDQDTRQARASIGVVPQEVNLDPFFTPKQILDIQSGLYGVPKNQRRSMELLELVGLADKAKAYSRGLSGGMKRRLMIAKAMVHNPPILVLDEPTAGVDVELRQMLWENVRALNAQGVTILLTTHYLEEAEELCDHIAIINHGEVIADEDTKSLISRIDSKELVFHLDGSFDISKVDLFNECPMVELEGNVLSVRYNPSDINAGMIITALQEQQIGIIDISTTEPDLEDVFLRLTSGADHHKIA